MNVRRVIGHGILAVVMTAHCVACAPHENWEPGSLYSVTGDDGTFAVVKVLARNPGVVSVRFYREKYPARPSQVDPAHLSLGQVGDAEGFGIGHLPLTERDFILWFPVLIQKGTVSEDEMEGYRIWKESGAGAFSLPSTEDADAD